MSFGLFFRIRNSCKWSGVIITVCEISVRTEPWGGSYFLTSVVTAPTIHFFFFFVREVTVFQRQMCQAEVCLLSYPDVSVRFLGAQYKRESTTVPLLAEETEGLRIDQRSSSTIQEINHSLACIVSHLCCYFPAYWRLIAWWITRLLNRYQKTDFQGVDLMDAHRSLFIIGGR